MRTGKSKVKATAGAVSVLLAGALSTAALAQPALAEAGTVKSIRSTAASDPAEMKRSITLAATGGLTTFLPYDQPRTIKLAQGTYDWENTFGPAGGTTVQWVNRTIVLNAGWYQWSCSLAGTGAAYPEYNYETACELRGVDDTNQYSTLPYQGVTLFKLKPGTYDWISWLTLLKSS